MSAELLEKRIRAKFKWSTYELVFNSGLIFLHRVNDGLCSKKIDLKTKDVERLIEYLSLDQRMTINEVREAISSGSEVEQCQ